MSNQHETASGGEEFPNAASMAALHPTIEALERVHASVVVIEGFIGTSKHAVVRLYEALDTSSYLEIPKEALVHLETRTGDEPGAVRAFVRATHEILSVQRSYMRAGDYRQIPDPNLSRLKTCADGCELGFKPLVTAYNEALARWMNETRPERKDDLWLRAETLKARAKDALYQCLTRCARTHPGQYFFGIGEAYQAILVRNHMAG